MTGLPSVDRAEPISAPAFSRIWTPRRL